jgi:hypothetical protein
VDWHLLIYRLPPQPSRARVAVWRELRRLGALPLQQAVVVVPATEPFGNALAAITGRIDSEGGEYYRFLLSNLSQEQDRQLIDAWNDLRNQEYAEIIEECETKFVKEIEFEIFRNNLTAAEAEEIEADLEKIRAWFGRVVERDRFQAANWAEASKTIERCQELLDDFIERVYTAELTEGPSLTPPVPLHWGTQMLEPERAGDEDGGREGGNRAADRLEAEADGDDTGDTIIGESTGGRDSGLGR